MVICFIGDSLTLGTGDDMALGWVGRLAQACFAVDPARHRATTICNLGVRGEASLRIAERWRAETDRRRRMGEDMAFVFSFGAADGLHKVPEAETLTVSRHIIKEAAGLNTTLYIAPPPARDPAWAAMNRSVGQKISAICKEFCVPTFDLYAPLADSAEYMGCLLPDGIHPAPSGYDRIAGLLRGWKPLADLLGI